MSPLYAVVVDYGAMRQDGGDLSQLDERALAADASQDPAAFTELYRRYLPRIHAFAYRRCQSRDLAEDITAATFERAYRMLPGFEWRGGGFGAWLFRIASNEIADHYRRHNRPFSERGQLALSHLAESTVLDDVERIDVGDSEHLSLVAALDTLPARYQEAISLRYLAGLGHEEAAAAMGVTKPVMAVTLSRALKALRKALAKQMTQDGA